MHSQNSSLTFGPHHHLLQQISSMEESLKPSAVEEAQEAAFDLSYPPLFLQSNAHPVPPPRWPSAIALAAASVVPVIDLQFLDPAALCDACKNWGLFRVVHHGIPSALWAAIQSQTRSLFSLPFDAKKARFSGPGILYFWGTPAVTLNLNNINWLEGFHIPLAQLRSVTSTTDFNGLESFRSLVVEYGQHMARIARTLFDALAVDLKLDSSTLPSCLAEQDGTFRVYRYPRCFNAAEYFAMEPHTDSSVLSIVNQDEVGGLQIRRNGDWFDIEPVAESLIVNLGDIMKVISDDEYISVEHRVVVNRDKERISLCYFAFPSEDCLISSSRYREFTYKEFKDQVQKDIIAYGMKVGLNRFKINDQAEHS